MTFIRFLCSTCSSFAVLLFFWASAGYSQTLSDQGASTNKAGAPVTITAFGNKLVVTSEDPEAVRLMADLARQLTATATGPGDFDVVHLKYANAVDTAKILDEMFNGPAPVAGAGMGAGAGRSPNTTALAAAVLAGMAGRKNVSPKDLMSMIPQRENRIRVVPDPAINALIIQASPLDILTIHNLLAKQLDSGVTDSEQIIKTFVIGPLKYAYATDVASVVRNVFRESMDNNARRLGQITNPFTGATRAPTLNIDANGNSKGVTLSLGIDNKTNSLIVACPTSMYSDIKKLVDQMEIAAADTKQTVKIVRLSGIDPALVQQAMDAIQGRPSPTRAGSGYAGQANGGSNRATNFGSTGLLPGGFGGSFQRGSNGFNNPTFMSGGNRGTGRTGG